MIFSKAKAFGLNMIIPIVTAGVIILWGLSQLYSLITNLALILTQVLNISIIYWLYTSIFIEGLILILLLFLIFKLIRNSEIPIKRINVNKAMLIKLGIIVLVLTLINSGLPFLTMERFENSVERFVMNNKETFEQKSAIFYLYGELAGTLRKGLIFVLYFLLVKKIDIGEITKANQAGSI